MLYLLYVPVKNPQNAEEIASELLKQNLAACINLLGPIRSYYRYEGVMESSQEYLMLVKVPQQKKKEAERLINQLHHYDLPCIASICFDDVDEKFLKWVESSCNITY